MLGLICLWMANVAHSGHRSWPSLMSLDLSRRDLFNGTSGIVTGALVCLQDLFIYLFTFFSLLSSQITRREERKKIKKQKKRLWIHIETPIMTSLVSLKKSRRNESNDIKKGQGDRSVPHEPSKGKWALTYLNGSVAHFSHCLWPFLVLLDSPRQNLFNGINDVVIGFSVCLQDFFFFVSLFFFSPFLSIY